jgi:hypothetical protein
MISHGSRTLPRGAGIGSVGIANCDECGERRAVTVLADEINSEAKFCARCLREHADAIDAWDESKAPSTLVERRS